MTDAVPSDTDSRTRVNSFDVFDTLIARRCIEPFRIFDQVGAKTKRPDFTAQRRRAEAAVAQKPHTIDDIYRELARNLGLSAAEADSAWEDAEIAAELDAAIPIAENIARVRDGDLLLSDMYLGEENVRRLLARAGFDKNVGLVVTANGKRSGELWPRLLTHFSIERHLGDNEHSDVAMPGRFGIACDHTRIAAITDMETLLLNAGLRDLAELTREARLRSWHADPVSRRLQLIQIYLNFPILLLSSIRLLRVAKIWAFRAFCLRQPRLQHVVDARARCRRTDEDQLRDGVFLHQPQGAAERLKRLSCLCARPSWRRQYGGGYLRHWLVAGAVDEDARL